MVNAEVVVMDVGGVVEDVVCEKRVKFISLCSFMSSVAPSSPLHICFAGERAGMGVGWY